MATRFLHKGLPLEQSPYSNVAPFAVDEYGVLRIGRGADLLGSNLSADQGQECVQVNRIIPVTGASATVSKYDDGATFVVTTTNTCTITLPQVATLNKGFQVTMVVGAVTGSGGHKFTPNASDTIKFTSAAASSSLECSAATDVLGDNCTLIGDGSTTWYIKSKTGTWAAIA